VLVIRGERAKALTSEGCKTFLIWATKVMTGSKAAPPPPA